MNVRQLLSHFDEIAEAPGAVSRLRQFILDLAVRGRLVEQDPSDESAAELLKRIQTEKAQLVEEGKIKEQEPHPPVDETEIGFELPPNWAMTRVGDLLTVIRGASPRPKGDPKYFSTERTPYRWIKISDIRKHSTDRVLYDTDEFLTETGMEKSVLLPKGTLVVTNSATVGVPILLGFDGGCIHDGYLAFPYFPSALSKPFFFVLFQTLQAYAVKKARGMAQLNLNTGLVREFPLGLPPLAEQHRIVAKVDELMALCDRLEAALAERERRRDRVVAASLHRLNQPSDDVECFRADTRFHLLHFPRFATRTEHVERLRETILNLAVRGKLVEQNSNDEPASELLNRIEAQKAGVSRKGKGRSNAATAHALPFDLPASWRAATVDNVVTELQTGPFGSSLHQSDYQRGGIPVVNPASIRNGRLVPVAAMAVGPATLNRLAAFKLRTGDIVLARRGEMGRCAVVTTPEDGWLCGTGSLILRLPESVFPRFLAMVIGSPFVREYLGGSAVGTTMQNLNQSILLGVTIGLPPLAEQRRIVAKVDELMVICDRLEAQLSTAQTQRARLLEAVLHEALEDRASTESQSMVAR